MSSKKRRIHTISSSLSRQNALVTAIHHIETFGLLIGIPPVTVVTIRLMLRACMSGRVSCIQLDL
ncbi:hypothetical protein J6590_060946 [Homalodisca vitripennis]|nr:hypothetical protein J6590_060946 [Homalodisca vitripennis]